MKIEVVGPFDAAAHLRDVHGWQWIKCAACADKGVVYCLLCDGEGMVLKYKDRQACGPACPLAKRAAS